MTPEQFEALKRWIDASTAVALGADDKCRAEAEQAAREAFLGKTHEQANG